ncbi:tRNA/tmRNA (uracil-C(5))-methyltransferase [Thalassocella blandensis]|nr:tRNA/tmRNA (uracil-C(5))-methyltransferase [Thalassocella blandensis]
MLLGQAQPETYEAQLEEKIQVTLEEFKSFNPPELEVFRSPAEHFRMRAEFKIWHENGEAHYAMFKQGEYKKPVKIEQFSIGSEKIVALMPALLKAINADELLKLKLFQVEFLTSTTGDAVISMIYHKPLNENWQNTATTLSETLQCKIIGRSRKQKIVISEDFITERFQLSNGVFSYQQVETGFTQPNASVCQHMLNWAIQNSANLGGDLLELYCGNGNFTLPLSRNFNRVLATEVSKTSVHSAQYNIQKNDISNITIARLSSEEFTQALNKEREFRRLKDIPLDDYQFSTVFVDPPRAGLDADTEQMVARFDNILYISCNPHTLQDNLTGLCKSHDIKAMALFDQFPYTDHRECGVLLKRK